VTYDEVGMIVSIHRIMKPPKLLEFTMLASQKIMYRSHSTVSEFFATVPI